MVRTLLGVVWIMTAPHTLAQIPDKDGEETGFRDVELVDGGPTKMEDKRDYTNLIIAGPTFFPTGINLRYQRLFNDRFSASLGAGYGSKKNALFTGADTSRMSVRLGADIHPVGNGMYGWYLGPRVMYRTWSFTASDASGGLTTLLGGAVAGWRWIADPGLSCGIGMGIGYAALTGELESGIDEIGIPDFSVEGTKFLFEFTLGWAF